MTRMEDLVRRVEHAEWIAQSALDAVAAKVVQAATSQHGGLRYLPAGHPRIAAGAVV